ncbi:glycosyltransferase [Cyclobacterium plantarum]|uniref:Glycosyltransferase family 4 protein n=1 Tax=Cyclobacterium plantarum TaxID=2716263 RepID=A0ABX0H1S3_9BACT|nr:glycosyltransferase [Cyclobacterium plantarum]NHE55554.1 glycosyltransferase family 4 protein [Cyclobacterium plantarum]
MENAYQLWKEGKSGSHHVWGKIELEKFSQINMVIFPHEKFKWLNKLGGLFGITHLDQQIRILFSSAKYDILYAPYSTQNTKLLLVLKLFRIYRKPIVVTIHSPFLGTNYNNSWVKWISKKLLLTYDASIYLSDNLMKQAIEKLGIRSEVSSKKIFTAQWGPDRDFYRNFKGKNSMSDTYLISAGHTSRDYETLIEAFKQLDYKLKIFCTPRSIPIVDEIPHNVTIYPEFIPYSELMNYYLNSSVILIPLKYDSRNEGCQGMTSIQDVVALGKPTIITKNKNLNLDVEKEGFGIFVDMGDVSGWVNAVKTLMNDKAKMKHMSENATAVYYRKFNAEIFGARLEMVFSNVYNSLK